MAKQKQYHLEHCVNGVKLFSNYFKAYSHYAAKKQSHLMTNTRDCSSPNEWHGDPWGEPETIPDVGQRWVKQDFKKIGNSLILTYYDPQLAAIENIDVGISK